MLPKEEKWGQTFPENRRLGETEMGRNGCITDKKIASRFEKYLKPQYPAWVNCKCYVHTKSISFFDNLLLILWLKLNAWPLFSMSLLLDNLVITLLVK